MTRIEVAIPHERPYQVAVSRGCLDRLGTELRELGAASQVLVMTDAEVAPRYLSQAKASLADAGYRVSALTLPAGEKAKSAECALEVWDAMADCGLSRDSYVVALGGGVVGDLAGFTASTFMRGLSVVQVPTTLLAMVDSSVGGKTAINLKAGKNLVGTFCQPRFVCADISVLASLPEREWSCGLGEVAKSALVDSDGFFFRLSDHAERLAARDPFVVQEVVERCIAFKASVVARDAHETSGVRECLNYGHTLAHALEAAAGYGVYSHGHAVAQGMRFAARLSVGLLDAPLELMQAQDALLDALGLPEITFKADPQELLALMRHDKKARSGNLRFVLLHDVGSWEVVPLDDAVVLEYLVAWQNSIT